MYINHTNIIYNVVRYEQNKATYFVLYKKCMNGSEILYELMVKTAPWEIETANLPVSTLSGKLYVAKAL